MVALFINQYTHKHIPTPWQGSHPARHREVSNPNPTYGRKEQPQ